MSELYQYKWTDPKGDEHPLSDYQGKVLLIVNTASKCGLTPQYKELQALHDKYHEQGLAIIGFPCNQFLSQEPGDDNDIASFCELNYGVSFPLSTKIKVNGSDADPLFKYLKKQAPGVMGSTTIKWNFNKFLISKDGTQIERFAPKTEVEEMIPTIEQWLGS
jgi:glutathione peroxidase